MTHDPMCPQYDCWLDGCTVCDECALIARVREDERQKTFDADWSEMGQLAAVRLFRMQAYADALRDAVEAVKAQLRYHEFSWGLDDSEDGDWIRRDYAIAAIESLGENP